MTSMATGRYGVRTITIDMPDTSGRGGPSRLVQTGWWVFDWKQYKTVQTFPMSEKEQANGLCKLLNSIEEETDGIPK